ncbi:acetyl esterase/lipase [Paenarthrobacter nitroguajacolicus]|uniref:alpha/beta hydrolase n=1 Tax=Paenarthrobacter TaxID=1742992 RepID=UPI00285C0CF0|nr:alpha/beta hydrolase [Paenarthrobacter nitroguajacolicus]MDR6989852.1 acetyl esterase/lipase [Paenarthrobacter nitroguajacolicus]
MTQPDPQALRALTVVPAVVPFGAAGQADVAAPAVLVLPGGGYAKQADHEAEPVAEWLASLGIHAFVLRYSVAPHQHPAPLEDAKQAMLWIRGGDHGLKVDPSRVGVLGFSAGGHLAATLSVRVTTGNPALDVSGAVPDLSILCYPVISFVDSVHQGSVDNLAGVGAAPEVLRELSTELHATPATPPAFLWHTADDESVPVSHSFAYAEALTRAGVSTELHVFPHGIHGIGLAAETPGADQWPVLCAAWLGRMGWTVQPS